MRRATILILTLGVVACGPDPDTIEPTPTTRPLEGVVVSDRAPPPLQGGTLFAARDGVHLLASDPDRDVVWVLDTETGERDREIALRQGDEPGRITEDRDGFFVVLRGAGSIIHVDGTTFETDLTRPVCDAPQGLDYDERLDVVHVACAGGELVTLRASGEEIRRIVLDRDLRDVVVDDRFVYVSRFRSAQVLVLAEDGSLRTRLDPPAIIEHNPGVAWRLTDSPNGGAILVHQQARTEGEPVVVTIPGGYGSSDTIAPCQPSIVQTSVTRIRDGAIVGGGSSFSQMVLPVDVAVQPATGQLAVAAAGNRNDRLSEGPAVGITTEDAATFGDFGGFGGNCMADGESFRDGRQVTAVTYLPDGRLAMQSRDPWQVAIVDGPSFALPGPDVKDSGHDLFHEDAGAGIACASCHPGGMDDGQTWVFEEIGVRRTQNIGGGIMGSEPFHWSGDMPDFSALVHEVLGDRMGGPQLPVEHTEVMASWIDTLPAPPTGTPTDAFAVERGRALFESAETECLVCHSGSRMSNNLTVDVGTGEALQVPSLVGLGMRAPYIHTGCAPTLRDRFNPACGGGDLHGKTSHLSEAEIGDLVAYLETL